ncbi:hypothetical protein RJ639_032855 [Escallonia herrerae]|uniref:Uncharacterized protein n=1 Tax=Escallonia herrerae TaxID=1293975 RepID=A0AA89BB89_9ASTE|nr:hypothetical protein RJ639_032855 [Escallonia herrerae]
MATAEVIANMATPSTPVISLPRHHLHLPIQNPSSIAVNNDRYLANHPTITLIDQCSKPNQLKQIHAQMLRTGLFSDPFSASKLISAVALSSSPNLNYARQLFDEIPHRNLYTWNALIRAYASSREPHQSLLIFIRMLYDSNDLPNKFTFPFVLKAAAELEASRVGSGVHGMVAALVSDLPCSPSHISHSSCLTHRSQQNGQARVACLQVPYPREIGRLHRLRYLNLRFNNLQGWASSNSSHTLDLQFINLAYNSMSGDAPTQVSLATGLQRLDISYNRLDGVIPQCYGNSSKYLFMLNLGNNRLHGTIPDTFPEGNGLMSIDFENNYLDGPVPRSWAYCRYLEILNLRNNLLNGTFPYWLEALPNLRVLALRSNRLQGSIGSPQVKTPFSKLRIIDLSDNELTGPLPMEYFKKFQGLITTDEKNAGLQYIGRGNYYSSVTVTIKGREVQMNKIAVTFTTIDFSSNRLTGEIPESLGDLTSLRLLNISNNSLTGQIPSSLGNMAALESLDLSTNLLVGKIHMQLTSCTFLAILNLSKNHLAGPIPRGNQFNTFGSDSYAENLALCGFPLSGPCTADEEPKRPPGIFQQSDGSFFYSELSWEVVALGYGFGFIFGVVTGYLAFLTGKPKWFVRNAEGNKRRKNRDISWHRQRLSRR